MSAKEDAALPTLVPYQRASNMTLRDWFAGQALVGIIACSNHPHEADEIVRSAWRAADLMLEARNA